MQTKVGMNERHSSSAEIERICSATSRNCALVRNFVFAILVFARLCGLAQTTNYEAVSRETSIFNFGQSTATYEANSHEVSVFNFGQSTATYEAISHEVSVYNFNGAVALLAIGSTNIMGNETNQVPFVLQTILDLTNLSLTLQSDDLRLRILGVTPVSPEVVSTVLGTVSSTGHPIAFTLNPAALPPTNRVLAYLSFQGLTNLDSAVVPLAITNFIAMRAGGQVVPYAATGGQVILIVNKPILLATDRPQFGITMYGVPGATYAVDSTTNLAPAEWHELERLLESGPTLAIPGLTNSASQQFYRTERVGP